MALTAQELAIAILNPQSPELIQLLNDEMFCDMLRITIHKSQDLRALEQFLEKNREQELELRKETRDQALREKSVMEENARIQQAASSVSPNEKEILLREMLEKINVIIASQEIDIQKYDKRIEAADEILEKGAAAWAVYQQAAGVQAQAIMQNALNNNLILNVNGQPVSAETAARLLANAVPADPMRAMQMYAESVAKAGGEFLNTTVDEVVKVINGSSVIQELNHIAMIGKDIGGVFDSAIFKLRKLAAHEKRDASAPNLNFFTETDREDLTSHAQQQKPTTQYEKGVPHKIQTFTAISHFPELDAVREPHMQTVRAQVQNKKSGQGASPLIDNIMTRMEAVKEKASCAVARDKAIAEHHLSTAQRDLMARLLSVVSEAAPSAPTPPRP